MDAELYKRGMVEQEKKTIAEQAAKRHSRIEARFERLFVAIIGQGAKMEQWADGRTEGIWLIAERVETFLEGKRNESKEA